mgnify:CR=1 FL=1
MTMRKAFICTTILAALAGCTQIVLATKTNQSVFGALASCPFVFSADLSMLWAGIPDALFVGGDAVVVQFFARMALMPGIVLASQCCPAGLGLEGALLHEGLVASQGVCWLQRRCFRCSRRLATWRR